MLILSVILKKLNAVKVLIQKNFKTIFHDHISRPYKIVCIDDKFTKPTIIYRGENAAYKFIKAILEEYEYFKKNNEKTF